MGVKGYITGNTIGTEERLRIAARWALYTLEYLAEQQEIEPAVIEELRQAIKQSEGDFPF
jgi:hypothetical protein